MPGHDVIVVGASSGGVEALSKLASQFPPDLPAAVFVVLHLSPHTPSALAEILGRAGTLPACPAADGDPIVHSKIYVAPPDHHLLVKPDVVRITRGPHENHTRPAIDPLFRSAAAAHGTRVVGVILSGNLDDGTSGLQAVKRCGGIAVVQEPTDAPFPDMPRNALSKVEADYVLPLAQKGSVLQELALSPAPAPVPIPDDILAEVQIAETGKSSIGIADQLGTLTPYSCPDCGGPMWQMNGASTDRFRCNVGHALTAQHLLAGQDDALSHALWEAVRTMEQRERLLEQMARDARNADREQSAVIFDERAAESKEHSQLIRERLLHVK